MMVIQHITLSPMYRKSQQLIKKSVIHNNKILTTKLQIATAYNKKYATKYIIPKQYKKKERTIKKNIHRNKHVQTPYPNSTQELFTKEFNTCELYQAINKLKNKRAPGPD